MVLQRTSNAHVHNSCGRDCRGGVEVAQGCRGSSHYFQQEVAGFENTEDFVVKDSLRLTFGCSQYEVSLMSPMGALVCRVFV